MTSVNDLFPESTQGTLEDELRKQVAEEIGNDKLNKETERLLYQKYGLMAVQLTNKERRVIERAERRRGR